VRAVSLNHPCCWPCHRPAEQCVRIQSADPGAGYGRVSNDGGKSVSKVTSPMPLRRVIWHPYDPLWAIAYEVDPDCKASTAFRCFGNLVRLTLPE